MVILAALVVDDTVLVLLLIEGDIIVKDCDGKLLLLFGDEK